MPQLTDKQGFMRSGHPLTEGPRRGVDAEVTSSGPRPSQAQRLKEPKNIPEREVTACRLASQHSSTTHKIAVRFVEKESHALCLIAEPWLH